MKSGFQYTPILSIILFVLFSFLLCINSDDSQAYTKEEKTLIPILYGKVKENLTQELMHEKRYIVRFLRAQNHDVGSAEGMIHRLLTWRNESKIDTILDEDWSPWIAKYPFTMHMEDFEGRPVLAAGLTTVDPRKLIVAGKGEELLRYMTYALERSVHNLNSVSKRTGKEFIDGYLLFNFAGYTRRSHACFYCIPLWYQFLNIYQEFYPQLARKLIIVNAPRKYETLKTFVNAAPSLYNQTKKALRIYGYDKGDWKAELLKIFPEEHLGSEFGGKGPNCDPQVSRCRHH